MTTRGVFAPEISCRVLSLIPIFVRRYGRERFDRAWARLDSPVDSEYLLDSSHWVSFDFCMRLLDVLSEEAGDEDFPFEAGVAGTSAEAAGIFFYMLRALAEPRLVYERAIAIAPTFNRAGTFTMESIADDRAVFVYRSNRPEPNDRSNRMRQGQYSSIPTLWGLPLADVRSTSIGERPFEAWRYEVRWHPTRSVAWPALAGAALGGAATGLLLPVAFAIVPGALFGGAVGLAWAYRRLLLTRNAALHDQDSGLVRSMRELTDQVVEIRGLNTALEQRRATLEETNARLTAEIAARREAEERLREADRLSMLGTLAAGVAHEINNPLTVMSLNVERLRDHVRQASNDPDELPAALGEISDGLDRVARIVRELKLLSRRDEAPDARGDLRAAADAALRLARHETRHRARVEVRLAETPPVAGDEGQLTQVVLNLLLNAAQALPEGQADAHVIRVRAGLSPTGGAFVEVSDTGPGIAPEAIDRIFDPFFTTKGTGTGLGLAISRRIVSSFGGRLGVESTPGQGATFRAEFPAAPPLDAPVAAAPPEPPLAARLNVLVVDDEESIGSALQLALSRDMSVVARSLASEALADIGRGERFDVIVCDATMPMMSGVAFLSALERVAPAQAERLIFMTGAMPGTREYEEVASRRPVVAKPFELASLRRVVRDVVRRMEASDKKTRS